MMDNKKYELFNTEDENAPPWSVVEIVKFNVAEGYIEVRKPTGDSLAEVMIVSGAGLRKDSRGTGFSPFDGVGLIIRYDTTDGQPAMGDDYGTEAGEWTLKQGKSGFVAWEVDEDFKIENCNLFQVKICNA